MSPFARALTAALRGAAPIMALGSTGALSYRIERLLGATTGGHGPSRGLGVLALCLALVCVAPNVKWLRAEAQSPEPAKLAFEVASVKPNKSGSSRVNFNPAPVGGSRQPMCRSWT